MNATHNPYEVTGPSFAEDYLDPAYVIRRNGRVIACVFAPDGDDEMCRRRAAVMAHALWDGEDDG
jgi:hypothetical protein